MRVITYVFTFILRVYQWTMTLSSICVFWSVFGVDCSVLLIYVVVA